jgi:competence ComEA-like helix-hairpin-helix protein
MGSQPAKPVLPWNQRQRHALMLLIGILCAVLAIQLAFNRSYIPDPQTSAGPRAAELATQLDPNTATWQELAAIPTLGEKRAKAIVEYRQKVLAQKPNAVVFNTLDDLTHIKGIKKASVENIKPYLMFPPGSAASR